MTIFQLNAKNLIKTILYALTGLTLGILIDRFFRKLRQWMISKGIKISPVYFMIGQVIVSIFVLIIVEVFVLNTHLWKSEISGIAFISLLFTGQFALWNAVENNFDRQEAF